MFDVVLDGNEKGDFPFFKNFPRTLLEVAPKDIYLILYRIIIFSISPIGSSTQHRQPSLLFCFPHASTFAQKAGKSIPQRAREYRCRAATCAPMLGNPIPPVGDVGEGLTADVFLSPRAWLPGVIFFFSSEYWLGRHPPRAPLPGGGGPLGADLRLTPPHPTPPRPTTRMVRSHP